MDIPMEEPAAAVDYLLDWPGEDLPDELTIQYDHRNENFERNVWRIHPGLRSLTFVIPLAKIELENYQKYYELHSQVIVCKGNYEHVTLRAVRFENNMRPTAPG